MHGAWLHAKELGSKRNSIKQPLIVRKKEEEEEANYSMSLV